jgi:2-octaprenyl-6-methoxyphenol hydroxylase
MQFDIIIVGGGMVGASLACALQDTNLQIALIDAAPLNTQDDPRLIALNHSSVCLFKNLGVWDMLAPFAAVISQVHISDRGHFGITRLTAVAAGVDALGHVVPAKNINLALEQRISTAANIHIFRPATLKKMLTTSTHVNVTLATTGGELALAGKLIIAADGTHSTVREELGIKTDVKDFQQSALVTVTSLQRSHQNIAYERFHSTGAIAMLPLPGLQVATIWTDSNNTIEKLMHLSDADFVAQLQNHFGYRVGKLLKTGKRFRYPLQHVTTANVMHDRIILIGNAAHTFHPIAAQGFNLALAEIAMLAEVIATDTTRQDWSAYQKWQTQRQRASQRLSHELPRLFNDDFLPLTLARQVGMIGLDICPPLKNHFTQAAMGKMVGMPSLLLDHDEQ